MAEKFNTLRNLTPVLVVIAFIVLFIIGTKRYYDRSQQSKNLKNTFTSNLKTDDCCDPGFTKRCIQNPFDYGPRRQF